MGIDWTNGLVELKTTSSVCSAVAIAMTIGRLYLRRQRFWWDDAWAFFSMLCVFVQIASAFMHVNTPSDISKTSRVAAYYIIASSFYAIIWSARLAILLSILRLEPNPKGQQHLRAVGWVFGVATVILISQLFWVCEPQKGWKDEPSPQCHLNTEVAICQVITDVLSDLFLCIWPLRIISGLKDGRLRRRLKIIFSTSIITTIVSLVHVGYLLTTGGVNLVIAAIVEDTVSLIVANLPVVFTAGLHLFGGLEGDVHADSQQASTLNMTGLKFKSRPRAVTTTLATSAMTRDNDRSRGGNTVTTTTGYTTNSGAAGTISIDPSIFGPTKTINSEVEAELGKSEPPGLGLETTKVDGLQ